jgi:UDP-glucose 4-epimerase
VLGLGHGAWPAPEAKEWGLSHWLNGEIEASNLNALRVAGGFPGAVVHLAGGATVGAAVAYPREDFSRTVGTTAELLEWLRQESPETRLVVASSAAVYGAGHAGLITEDAPVNPSSPYGYHKWMMEALCRSYGSSFGLRTVVARMFSVYGPGLKKQLLWDLCSKLGTVPDTVELGGSGKELRDWIDVRDAVRVLSRLAEQAAPSVPTFNIGTGIGTPVRDVAEHVLRAWHGGKSRTQLRFTGVARTGDPFSLVAGCARLSSLGLTCDIALRDGLEAYVAWFRNQGTM